MDRESWASMKLANATAVASCVLAVASATATGPATREGPPPPDNVSACEGSVTVHMEEEGDARAVTEAIHAALGKNDRRVMQGIRYFATSVALSTRSELDRGVYKRLRGSLCPWVDRHRAGVDLWKAAGRSCSALGDLATTNSCGEPMLAIAGACASVGGRAVTMAVGLAVRICPEGWKMGLLL